jgi:hypothetical protein
MREAGVPHYEWIPVRTPDLRTRSMTSAFRTRGMRSEGLGADRPIGDPPCLSLGQPPADYQ